MILIDSVYIKDKNYYPQVFLGKYKHVIRKKRSYFITYDIKSYFDDSDEKTEMKKIKCISLLLKEIQIISYIYIFKENKKNIRNFCKLGVKKFPFRKYKRCFKSGFFHFSICGSYFLLLVLLYKHSFEDVLPKRCYESFKKLLMKHL